MGPRRGVACCRPGPRRRGPPSLLRPLRGHRERPAPAPPPCAWNRPSPSSVHGRHTRGSPTAPPYEHTSGRRCDLDGPSPTGLRRRNSEQQSDTGHRPPTVRTRRAAPERALVRPAGRAAVLDGRVTGCGPLRKRPPGPAQPGQEPLREAPRRAQRVGKLPGSDTIPARRAIALPRSE